MLTLFKRQLPLLPKLEVAKRFIQLLALVVMLLA